MKPIAINIRGHTVLVDQLDYFKVSQYKWHINDNGYAVWRGIRDGKKLTVRMHRLIMDTPDGMDTDHINRNRLDNRRSNLRICDRKTNLLNGSRHLNAKGYWYDKSKGNWQVNSTPRRRFKTEQEAIEYVKELQ